MSSTRLLIDIRAELEMWQAEQWANIAYGSIYFALNKMAGDGLIEVVDTDQTGKKSARTRYRITDRGRLEFQRLLYEAWWADRPVIDPFQVALTFMQYLPHEQLLGALRYRAHLMRTKLAAMDYANRLKLSHPDTPRHTVENLRLVAMHLETTLRWLEEVIGKVERGELP